ncbi:MFS transporter [Microbacterium sufflavum]|uniref:MFS transporter n=1 Tax=Microbacterium sufflavum TaxID=2851649 RepID=A0ABY4IG66_9MICO|nr:MFS transporter [Microbacterium sufflavum]
MSGLPASTALHPGASEPLIRELFAVRENTYPSPLARWLIFAVVLVADVIDLLSSTVTNIATPSILEAFGAPDWLAPWLGASYALALGSMLVLGARLGDRHGARRVFLIGLCGFGAASALCAFAPTAGTLVLFRVIQGAFGALMIPQGFTLLLRSFPRDKLGPVFGLFGPLMAVSSISGPVLAGLVISADPLGLGWRAVFVVNVLVAAALLVLAIRTLPRIEADAAVTLDPLAVILLSVGLLGVLGALTLLQAPLTPWWPVLLGALGIAALAAFVAQQRRARHPLLAPSLFRKRSFTAGVVVGVGFFAVTAGVLFATTLYLQIGLGLAVLPAAAIVAAASVGIIAASFSTRALIPKLGRRLLLIGLVLLLVGVSGYLAVIALASGSPWLVAIPLFICGLGMGCGFGTVFAVALGDVDDSETGSASGALNAAQQIATAIGAAVISISYLGAAGGTSPQAGLLVCLFIVLVCTALSLLTLPLLPRRAAGTH